ncbi:MAG: dihydrodipicolinate synthase family protein [Actinomycetota bacterium]|nr:dihydrodipicolinate synthase family protein [Actinomycetota bacterium]
MTLHGVYTIALTPFTDEGDLDEESIGPLSEFYVDADVHGLTILGIMGEAHKLSDAERRMVLWNGTSLPSGGAFR